MEDETKDPVPQEGASVSNNPPFEQPTQPTDATPTPEGTPTEPKA